MSVVVDQMFVTSSNQNFRNPLAQGNLEGADLNAERDAFENEIVSLLPHEVPILGVCRGHQFRAKMGADLVATENRSRHAPSQPGNAALPQYWKEDRP